MPTQAHKSAGSFSGDYLDLYDLDSIRTETLQHLRSMLAESLDETLDAFYDTAARVPETAKHFRDRDHMRTAATKQRAHWFDGVLKGEWGADFRDRAEVIGKVHERIGLPPGHYIAAYAFTLRRSIEAIGRKRTFRPQQNFAAVGAFVTAALFDMDIVISAYLAEEQKRRLAAEEQTRQLLEGAARSFDREIKGIIDGVAAASTELSATAELVAMHSANTANRASGLSAAARQLEQSAQSVEQQGNAASNQLQHSIASINSVVNAAAQLTDAAGQINTIVDLITEVSNRTRLLALNASIEAARAGEAGKGFNIVAGEVKNLANQTADSSSQIMEKVSVIQQIVNAVNEDVKVAAASANAVVDTVGRITGAVREQVIATTDVARSSTELLTFSTESGAGAEESKAATLELNRQAEMLRMQSESFIAELLRQQSAA